ncbi:EamA family transporter [Mucilaginibacter flavus]|uniref:EamA family transporter n=1 Tax=Mucilaginibacter flavus TaxID=931504 RepID=UPI0025B2E1FA|nr:EamA family transporter [Mucilaginibacter flavus]MDN3582141.1 EamA family transporter [Mucilaginibacter flavus]
MTTINQKKAPTLWVIVAFATVYIVWGSTYFFIQMAVHGFPAMLMGALRYTMAGLLMLGWCAIKGDRIWVTKDVIKSGISGLIMLFVATGIVFWVEQTLPSAMVAITVSTGPIWFVALDKVNWRVNFKSKSTIGGLVMGFAGVILLFGEQVNKAFIGNPSAPSVSAMLLLVLGPVAWSAGSLYSKKHATTGPARLNSAWQMIIAGIAFIPAGIAHHEFSGFSLMNVPAHAWWAIVYLILFGSIAAFSAYVWLLQVKPATQVSTHSYVNPVIAVLLGVLFAAEHISLLQVIGLVVILLSVLLINLAKYRKTNTVQKVVPVTCNIVNDKQLMEAC